MNTIYNIFYLKYNHNWNCRHLISVEAARFAHPLMCARFTHRPFYIEKVLFLKKCIENKKQLNYQRIFSWKQICENIIRFSEVRRQTQPYILALQNTFLRRTCDPANFDLTGKLMDQISSNLQHMELMCPLLLSIKHFAVSAFVF